MEWNGTANGFPNSNTLIDWAYNTVSGAPIYAGLRDRLARAEHDGVVTAGVRFDRSLGLAVVPAVPRFPRRRKAAKP